MKLNILKDIKKIVFQKKSWVKPIVQSSSVFTKAALGCCIDGNPVNFCDPTVGNTTSCEADDCI